MMNGFSDNCTMACEKRCDLCSRTDLECQNAVFDVVVIDVTGATVLSMLVRNARGGFFLTNN